MVDFTYKAEKKEDITQHPDYERNVNWGAKFVSNYDAVSPHKYFYIRVVSNLDGVKYYFEFNFNVQNWEGNAPQFASPVNPNQNYEDFHKEFKDTYLSFYKMHGKYEKKIKAKAEFAYFDHMKEKETLTYKET